MEQKIKERISELQKIKNQLMANLNAANGAIIELENLLKKEDTETKKDDKGE